MSTMPLQNAQLPLVDAVRLFDLVEAMDQFFALVAKRYQIVAKAESSGSKRYSGALASRW